MDMKVGEGGKRSLLKYRTIWEYRRLLISSVISSEKHKQNPAVPPNTKTQTVPRIPYLTFGVAK